ncbi:LPS translocon maturation chaperone LptM [Inhella inkyongensis]
MNAFSVESRPATGRKLVILALLGALAMLAGCGQKGPLRLPPQGHSTQ